MIRPASEKRVEQPTRPQPSEQDALTLGMWCPTDCTAVEPPGDTMMIPLQSIVCVAHNADLDSSAAEVPWPLVLVVQLRDGTKTSVEYPTRKSLKKDLMLLVERLGATQYVPLTFCDKLALSFERDVLEILKSKGIEGGKVKATFEFSKSEGRSETETREWDISIMFNGMTLSSTDYFEIGRKHDYGHSTTALNGHALDAEFHEGMSEEDYTVVALKDPFWKDHVDVTTPLLCCLNKHSELLKEALWNKEPRLPGFEDEGDEHDDEDDDEDGDEDGDEDDDEDGDEDGDEDDDENGVEDGDEDDDEDGDEDGDDDAER